MDTSFQQALLPKVAVIGVGGAGCNAMAGLMGRSDLPLHIICANTDAQALAQIPEYHRLQLGQRLTAGLGAGAHPEVGEAAAEETGPEIISALAGMSLCFVAAGMGGGTGTGAAPVIARIARSLGILTVGIATRPFAFEGTRRARVAEAGIVEFRKHVDALIVVCNEHLFRIIGPDTSALCALSQSDAVICDSVTDIAALVSSEAIKSVTMADLWALLGGAGRTVIGYGAPCSGPDRAMRAAASAMANPLLEDAAQGAGRLLATVSGGDDLTLFEVDAIIAWLREQVDPDAELVWGSSTHASLTGSVRVGLVASALPAPVPPTVQPLSPVPANEDMPMMTTELALVSADPETNPARPVAQHHDAPEAQPSPALVAQIFPDDSASGPLFQYEARRAAPPAPVTMTLPDAPPAMTSAIIPAHDRPIAEPSRHPYHPSLVDRICAAITGRATRLPPMLAVGDGKAVMGPAFKNRAAQTGARAR